MNSAALEVHGPDAAALWEHFRFEVPQGPQAPHSLYWAPADKRSNDRITGTFDPNTNEVLVYVSRDRGSEHEVFGELLMLVGPAIMNPANRLVAHINQRPYQVDVWQDNVRLTPV